MTKFSCDCGSQLEAEEVEVHFSTCEKVGEKYGLVFQALKALVNKNPVPDTWHNMKVLASHFKQKLFISGLEVRLLLSSKALTHSILE